MKWRSLLALLMILLPTLATAKPSQQAIQQWGAKVVAQVEANWYPPAGIDSRGLQVQLTIQRTQAGGLRIHKVRQSSGHTRFDDSVISAIKRTHDLPSPPQGCGICNKRITFNFAPGAKPQPAAQIQHKDPQRIAPAPRVRHIKPLPAVAQKKLASPPKNPAPSPKRVKQKPAGFTQAIKKRVKQGPTAAQTAADQAQQQAWMTQLHNLWRQNWQKPEAIETASLSGQWRIKWDGMGGVEIQEMTLGSGHMVVDQSIARALQEIQGLTRPPARCKICQDSMLITFEPGSLKKQRPQPVQPPLPPVRVDPTADPNMDLELDEDEDMADMESALQAPKQPRMKSAPLSVPSAVEQQRAVARWFKHVRAAVQEKWIKPGGDTHQGRTMMIRIQWLENGTLEWVTTVRPSGHETFDESVLKAVEAVDEVADPPEGCSLCLRPIYITLHNE
ncbi:TonB family protein [Magnetococcus sp. PR-3]|uniref:TonB family protein n=1 Tax=Magnetococcus sp. PR-3 TaxID=3120355 RepID=UPI002FCE1044